LRNILVIVLNKLDQNLKELEIKHNAIHN
jgi:hypothetical protein